MTSTGEQHISERMRRVRSKGTGAELLLLQEIRKLGRRPQLNVSSLRGKPDLVFNRERLACFVDGDYWHGHQWVTRGLGNLEEQFVNSPDERRAYWVNKIHGNINRDLAVTSALLQSGWAVLRLWESAVLANPEKCAKLVMKSLHCGATRNPIARIGLMEAADFFAGIGLMKHGLAQAGWRTVWANDFDPLKQKIYRTGRSAKTTKLDTRDIALVRSRDVPRVGLAAACFPCTDLSEAGKRTGLVHGSQSSAFLEFARILQELGGQRPPFVVLENVVGLAQSKSGKDFSLCLRRLAEAGYTVDATLVDARHFVPQSRKRLFIVGTRSDLSHALPSSHPRQLTPSSSRPKWLLDFILRHPKIPWSLRPLPAFPECQQRLVDVLDDIDSDHPEWWSRDRVAYLRDQIPQAHKDQLKVLAAKEGEAVVTAFRRMRYGESTAELRFDGIAGCLRTPKGGSAKQIVIRVRGKKWQARNLTARECERLMGAEGLAIDLTVLTPDEALMGFGDGVCVPAVQWLLRHHINVAASELIRGRALRIAAEAKA